MGRVTEILDLIHNEGRIYELSVSLENATPVSPVHTPFRMALTARHGDWVRDGGLTGAAELLVMSGHTGTHIDALSHVARNGKLFGGVDAAAAVVNGRFAEFGVDTISPIVTRGILLDIPKWRGVESLPPEEGIGRNELEDISNHLGVVPGPNDAVLIRTGWRVGRYQQGSAFVGWETGVPGIDESGAEWLGEHGVVLAGSDTIAFERIYAGLGHSRLPVHGALLVDYGIHIVEMMNLDGLAADNVYEFLLLILPLPIVGGTGSPIRPVAVTFG